jgi:hypothetical protein
VAFDKLKTLDLKKWWWMMDSKERQICEACPLSRHSEAPVDNTVGTIGLTLAEAAH